MNDLKLLRELAKRFGLTVKDCGNGHFQVLGGLVLVNYWPDSKKRTAYIGSTRNGEHNAGPHVVIDMALKPPPFVPGVSDRHNKRAKRFKENRFRKNQHQRCYWCSEMLTPDTATVDHKIPLARGGLDNHNNMELACEPCNRSKGHEVVKK